MDTLPTWYTPEDPTSRETCPCCDYVTLPERGRYIICPVCYWEDEGIDINKLHKQSGANNGLTLHQARANFRKFGAFEERRVKSVCSAAEREQFERRPRNVG